MTHLQKFPKNVGDLGKLIFAKCFKKLPKVQKIAQSGHTGYELICESDGKGKERKREINIRKVTSVTKLGALLDFGQLFKAFGNN